MDVKMQLLTASLEFPKTNQANNAANSCRKIVEYVYCQVEPFREPIVVIPRWVKPRNLVSKNSEDGIRGVAGFKPAEQGI